MFSLHPQFLQNLKFSPAQLGVLKSIGAHQGRQQLYVSQKPESLATLRQASVIESTESSNRIEGVTAPHDRIQDLVLKHAPPKNRPEQEIAGYRDALNIIHESAEHMAVATPVILQLHSMIERYVPAGGGRWKNADNKIVARRPDGTIAKVLFEPVSAFETPRAMEKLVELYKDALETKIADPLVLLPLFILDFLCVHPFSDGNGRVSRLLTLMMLYQHQFEVGRYISLERIVEDSKETYYQALQASDQKWHEGSHDPHPWLNYYWGVLERAYQEFEERMGKLGKGGVSKTDLVRQAILRKMVPFSITDILNECPGVSRVLVKKILALMKEEEFIKPSGKGRSARWHRLYREKK